MLGVPRLSQDSRFNPRSREGSDQTSLRFPIPLDGFNPRSREGSDNGPGRIVAQVDEFQSTLPRGERHRRFCAR